MISLHTKFFKSPLLSACLLFIVLSLAVKMQVGRSDKIPMAEVRKTLGYIKVLCVVL